MKFLTEDGQREIKAAIAAIEEHSSAEVVVAVRQRLSAWPSAHVAIGLLAALAMLTFQLYVEDIEYEYWALILLPLLVGVTFGLLVELAPPIQRALTSPKARERRLTEASRAAFYELGVHKTRGRTGLLVFVAVRDRRVALVGDVAVAEALPDLQRHAAPLVAEIPKGLVAVASKLRALGPVLGKPLPKAADDIDELANAVHAVGRRKASRRAVAR